MAVTAIPAIILFIWCASLGVWGAQRGISLRDKVNVIEGKFVDEVGVVGPVTPCSLFLGDSNTGEQTSAEWIRIIFHDFITADVDAGTGGLDASIAFESNRAENTGMHFINDTLNFFLFLIADPYTSLADSMVLDLDTTLATFAKAGFNQSEAIMAVYADLLSNEVISNLCSACGHSLGGVHQVDFPDIVSANVITSNNTDGTEHFDSTPYVFDHIGISEYLQGTGKCGRPLVVGFNETTRSDLRLFQSDGNTTMQSLATAESFKEKCAYIFERMMNTVPASVELSEPILPMKWKLRDYSFSMSADGILSISGDIRYLCGQDQTCVPAPPTLSYKLCTADEKPSQFQTAPFLPSNNNGSSSSCIGQCCGSSLSSQFHGNWTKYCFSNNMTVGITALSVMDEYTYELETGIVILSPSMSLHLNESTNIASFSLSVAVLTTLVQDRPVTALLTTIPVVQPLDASSALNIEVEKQLKMNGTAGQFTIFEGNVEFAGPRFGDIVVQAGIGGLWSETLQSFLTPVGSD